MLFMLGYQNTARLTTVLVPTNCRVVRSCVHAQIDKNDGRPRDNLLELSIQRPRANSIAMIFVLTASYQYGLTNQGGLRQGIL